jgi:hypothetical protein
MLQEMFFGKMLLQSELRMLGYLMVMPALILGTTDFQNLNFRTNNTQRMTILAQNGFVGVGVANPRVRLHVSNNIGTMGFPYESAVVENGGDTKFTVASSDPTGAGGASIVLGHSNFTTAGAGGQRYHGYEMQYAINGARWLRFNYVQRDAAGSIVDGSIANIMVLSDQGRVGIGLGPVGGGGQPVMPTAVFHTNGAIRFQNLPAGTGNVLVVDANGNVFRSANTARMATQSDAGEMKELKDELRQLRAELESLKKLVAGKNASTRINEITISQKPQLLQNAPNPFTETTTIKYQLPQEVQNAAIYVSTLQGTRLRHFILPQGGGQSVSINGGELAAGSYIYSLVVNGKVIDSKKMVLVR